MAKGGVNRVTLLGRMGADPEVRYTGSGSAITTISVATTEAWRDKQSGEQQERTEWHRVKFFGRLAEIAGEYLRKGSQVYIEGSLRTDKYTDKNQVERYVTEIIANEMQLLGSRQDGGESRVPQQRGQDQQAGAHQGRQPSPRPQQSAQRAPEPAYAGANGFDEPF